MLRTRYMTHLSVGWKTHLHSLLLTSLLGSLGDLASGKILKKRKVSTAQAKKRL